MRDHQFHEGNNVSKYGAENTCHVQSAAEARSQKGGGSKVVHLDQIKWIDKNISNALPK
jgi:hypothetical protein